MSTELTLSTSPSASPSTAETPCFHCGLPVADPNEFTLRINTLGEEKQQSFCCPGCQAITSAIYDGGLEQFYQYRSEMNRRPEQGADDFTLYDRPDIQQSFVDIHVSSDHSASKQEPYKTAHLLLDDITCAACVWLIEKRVGDIAGVEQIRVNASTHQCLLRWDESQVPLSELMSCLLTIGYRPQPLTHNSQEQQRHRKQRTALMRLGVAAFGMMQVSMVSIGLYAGALQGMDPQWQSLLRWVSLVVATPVVLFSAQPFWSAAWRSLRQRHLTMEVPVSLAIILAYCASVWATVDGSGEVYFDSVSMFTFFLLIGRYLEMRTRYRNQQQTANFTRLLPMAVQRVSVDDTLDVELIPLAQLSVGDRVRVNSGETIPCDGVVLDGDSAVIEALLTGEAEPVSKQQGDRVIAGTVNTDGCLLLQATAVDQQTRLSTIETLVNFAQQDKPVAQVIADKVASYFVAAVLLVASSVFIFWWLREPDAALWITLSVLVVTCPCALSLATPTVLTATVAKMRACGLLVLKGHVIEGLTSIRRVIFDKTGTLTYGEPRVEKVLIEKHHVHCNDNSPHDNDVYTETFTEEHVLALAASLEEGSSHPIARAFVEYAGKYNASEHEIVTGAGVSATIDNEHYRLGKPSFASNNDIEYPSEGQWLLLSKNYYPLAWILLSDTLRGSAHDAVEQLHKKSIIVEILSGDNHSVVASMASALGGLPFSAGASPEKKLQHIQQQQQSAQVLMVGDGINDVPVLAGANISVAMDSASDFARTHADTVLLSSDLSALPKMIDIAQRCRRIIRQNIAWALFYNLLALPLAAMGLIPPYLAALGMSLSSLIVVMNALRIHRD